MQDADTGHPIEGPQPHSRTLHYATVAGVLLVLTAAEVSIYYVPALHPVLVPALLTLAAAKFALVVLFYMHLKRDHRLFSWLFATPLVIAALVIVALMKLFRVF